MTSIIKIVTLGSVLLLGAGATLSRNEPDEEGVKAANKEVDIMRRVLVKGLKRAAKDLRGTAGGRDGKSRRTDGELAREAATEALMAQNVFSNTRYGVASRAWLLPGSGAFFSLDFKVKAVEVERKPRKDEKPKKGDLWDEAENEAAGRRAASDFTTALTRNRSNRKVRHAEIDPDALDKAIDVMVGLLARHGGRMTHLAKDGYVTVAATVSGDARSLRADSEDSRAITWFLYGSTAGKRRVVIRVPVRVLRDMTSRTTSDSEARRSMSITQYVLESPGQRHVTSWSR